MRVHARARCDAHHIIHVAHTHMHAAWPYLAKAASAFLIGSRQLVVPSSLRIMAEGRGRKWLPVHVPAVSPRELTATTALKRGIPPGAQGGIQILGMVLVRPLVGTCRDFEVIEIRAPLRAESAHPDVRHGTRIGVSSCCYGGGTTRSVVEYVTSTPAVTYAHASPVVEYVTPARTVARAAPVTSRTAATTVFPTATTSCPLQWLWHAKPQLQHCGCAQWFIGRPRTSSTTIATPSQTLLTISRCSSSLLRISLHNTTGAFHESEGGRGGIHDVVGY